MTLGRTVPIRDSIGDLVNRGVVVEFGILVALFIGFYIYTIALDNVLDPYFLDSDIALLVVRSLLILAGIGVLVVSYASWRGFSLPVSIPDRSEGRLVGIAMASTGALATLPFLLLALRFDVGTSHVIATVADMGEIFLNRTLIRITLFVSGMVLLYHGIVQGAFQRVFGQSRDLAVVVTTLLSGYLVTPNVVTYGTFAQGPWLFLWGTRAVVAVLFVLALSIAVYVDERDNDGQVPALATVPVLVTLALATLVLAVEADSPIGALVMTT